MSEILLHFNITDIQQEFCIIFRTVNDRLDNLFVALKPPPSKLPPFNSTISTDHLYSTPLALEVITIQFLRRLPKPIWLIRSFSADQHFSSLPRNVQLSLEDLNGATCPPEIPEQDLLFADVCPFHDFHGPATGSCALRQAYAMAQWTFGTPHNLLPISSGTYTFASTFYLSLRNLYLTFLPLGDFDIEDFRKSISAIREHVSLDLRPYTILLLTEDVMAISTMPADTKSLFLLWAKDLLLAETYIPASVNPDDRSNTPDSSPAGPTSEDSEDSDSSFKRFLSDFDSEDGWSHACDAFPDLPNLSISDDDW